MCSDTPADADDTGEDDQRDRPLFATALAANVIPVVALALAATPTIVESPSAVGFLGGALDWIVAVDMAVVDLVLAIRHPVLTKFMTSVTGLGSATAAAVFLGVAALAGWRRELRVAGVALVLAGILVAALMALVHRPFPPQPVCLTAGDGVGANSFPSGHAAAATIYALVARDSPDLPFAPVAVLGALVAVSRVYLGTHYASDTVVGIAIGLATVLLARRLLQTDRIGTLAHRLS